MDDEQQRFETLFREAYPPVTRYVIRRVDPDAVHEVVSQVFLTAWRRFDSVPEHALPWLLITARNLIGNEYRRRARTEQLTHKLAAALPSTPTDPTDATVERISLHQALATLRPLDQEALRLADWDGLTATDAAAVAGCNAATYKVRLHRARRRLRAVLTADYDTRQPELTLLTPEETR